MQKCAVLMRHRMVLAIIPCLLVFVLAFSACGTNSTSTGSTAPTSTATTSGATATPTQSQATKDGCPNATVVTTAPPAPNVTLTSADNGSTVNAKKGDMIEINLPFGHAWQGPLTISQNLLEKQGPAGFAYPSAKSCVWRFLATATGTAHLSFEGRPICQKNQACPMYVMAVILTVNIK